ncbi:hypothetical protein ACFOHY_16270 [Rhizobium rosettiformans]|uniref:hypothetical protein n=1 Tax=Rhizobium rosettiformans TaxID=1368430 RepID=UPI0036159A89
MRLAFSPARRPISRRGLPDLSVHCNNPALKRFSPLALGTTAWEQIFPRIALGAAWLCWHGAQAKRKLAPNTSSGRDT